MKVGGHDWDDEVKWSYLDNMLNWEMHDWLVTVEKKESFLEYIVQLQLITDCMEKNTNWQNNNINCQANCPNLPNFNTNLAILTPPAVPQNNQMDWEPTVSQHQSQKTAKWVSKEEMNARKQQNLCICCRASGHFIGRCPYNTPYHMNISRTQVAPQLEDGGGDERVIMEPQSGKE